MTAFSLEEAFSKLRGRRVRRTQELPPLSPWQPTQDELAFGPRTNLADGIYIATLSEKIPTERIELASKATLASERQQHRGPDFLPGPHYDSAVAVQNGRIAGAALAKLECRALYVWNVSLKENGTAYKHEELTEENGLTFNGKLGDRPTVFTIWVHTAHRRKGIGRQLVAALAEHFSLAVNEIGFRLPLSKDAVHMLEAMGLKSVIGCF